MIKFAKLTILTLAISALVLGVSGCKKEEAAVEDAEKAIEKVTDEATQQVEKAGEQVKDAAKDAVKK